MNEREEFEGAVLAESGIADIGRSQEGFYINPIVRAQWHGWQLRGALSQQEAEPVAEDIAAVTQTLLEDVSYCDFRTSIGFDKARTLIRRALKRVAPPRPAPLPEPVSMGIEIITLENDLSNVCGNTIHATAEHLLRLGYRKNPQPVASKPQDVDVAFAMRHTHPEFLRNGQNNIFCTADAFYAFLSQRDAAAIRPVAPIRQGAEVPEGVMTAIDTEGGTHD